MKPFILALVALSVIACGSGLEGPTPAPREIQLLVNNVSGGPVAVYLHGENGRIGTLEPGINCATLRLPTSSQSHFRLGLRLLGEPHIQYSTSAYSFGTIRFWHMFIASSPDLMVFNFNSLSPGPACVEVGGDRSVLNLRIKSAR